MQTTHQSAHTLERLLPGIIEGLYEAVFDDESAYAVLHELKRWCGAREVVLSFSSGDRLPSQQRMVNGEERIPPHVALSLQDPWLAELLDEQRNAMVLRSGVVTPDEDCAGKIYTRIKAPPHGAHVACALVPHADAAPSYVYLQRSRSADDWDAAIGALLRGLYPHLQRAAQVYQASLRHPVNAFSSVTLSNPQQMVEAVQELWASVFGALAMSPFSLNCLSSPLPPRRVTPLEDCDGSLRWLVTAIPDPMLARASLYIRSFPSLVGITQLSETERHLLIELIRGYDVAHYSACYGRSKHTVRTQLKSLMRKLGCRSQRMLLDQFPP